jgi:hypothetical protein
MNCFANDELLALLKEKEKMMSLGNTLGFKNLSKFYFLDYNILSLLILLF